MTLTPSVRAISRCSFPCVARSFACASFDAISTLECLFFLATAASLRPTNVIAHVRILLRRLNGPYKDLTRTLQGPYKDLTRTLQGNAVFPCRFRSAEQVCAEAHRLGIAKKSGPMATFAAPHS